MGIDFYFSLIRVRKVGIEFLVKGVVFSSVAVVLFLFIVGYYF